VDNTKLEKDPRKLAFLFPSMPVARYKIQTEEYYKLLCLRTIEQVVQMQDAVLLPSSCVHQKRRDPSRRISLFGRSYYVVPVNQLTATEAEKYQNYCIELSG